VLCSVFFFHGKLPITTFMKKPIFLGLLFLLMTVVVHAEGPVVDPLGSAGTSSTGLQAPSLGVSLNMPVTPSGTDISISAEQPKDPWVGSKISGEERVSAAPEEIPFVFDFDSNCIVDIPELSSPGDTVTIDCVITSQNWDPLGVKAQFGVDEQVYLEQVSANPKHWQGVFTYPGLLPEGNYTMAIKLLVTSKNISQKPIEYSIKRKIVEVIITGNDLVSINELQACLMVVPGEYFTPLKAESDVKRLFDTGFVYSATMNTAHDPAGNLILTYIVIENPVIDEIVISGNTVFVDYTIISKMRSKPGEMLDNNKLLADIKMIEDMYHENQYILAKVREVRRPGLVDKKKVLEIDIAEIKVASITVRGNKSTKDFTILREMEMKPGLVFDRDMLQTDLRNIFNLNYFKNVYPDVRPSPLSDDLVDVFVNVEEKKTNSVNFGGGYGQLDGWFGFVDLFLDNLWGEARSMLLKAQFGELRTSYQLRYYDPWALPDHTSFAGKIWSTYGYSYLANYIEQRNGWDLEFGRPLSRHVRGSIHTTVEDVFFPNSSEEDEFRRGIGASIAYDTRDYVQNPTQGDFHVFRVDKLLAWFGGNVDNWKYSLSLERFFPLEKPPSKYDPEFKVKQVLATRLLFDIAEGEVRETEEYYVGSDNTVRGYSRLFQRGRQRWIGNLEYRYLFNEIFQGVLFYDMGWAGYTSSDFDNPQRYTTGKGIGLRINTPLGPIRLDWGWKEYALFSDGYLHFSIGHAF
jgi:outer membrane protein insertion porin family